MTNTEARLREALARIVEWVDKRAEAEGCHDGCGCGAMTEVGKARAALATAPEAEPGFPTVCELPGISSPSHTLTVAAPEAAPAQEAAPRSKPLLPYHDLIRQMRIDAESDATGYEHGYPTHRAKESEAELRAAVARLTADLEVAESRKAQAFHDLKHRAEKAEAALEEARMDISIREGALDDQIKRTEAAEAALEEARRESERVTRVMESWAAEAQRLRSEKGEQR